MFVDDAFPPWGGGGGGALSSLCGVGCWILGPGRGCGWGCLLDAAASEAARASSRSASAPKSSSIFCWLCDLCPGSMRL